MRIQKKYFYSLARCLLLIILLLTLLSCGVPREQNNQLNSSKGNSPPISTFTRVLATAAASYTPTRLVVTITPTATTEPNLKPSITASPIQAEESIPICQNPEKPSPPRDIPGIIGKFFYSSMDGKQLFSFSGVPPRSKPVALNNAKFNRYVFSKDGQWLLAYSHIPEGAPCYQCKPLTIWLISKDGRIETKTIDVSEMITSIHDGGYDTYSLQDWEFEWVTPQIIKVSVGFGEFDSKEYFFGYFDIIRDTWWDEPLQDLPGREPGEIIKSYKYEWTDISPDLTRMLYLNSNYEVVLWDLEQRRELWRSGPGNYFFIPEASWSSDSQSVAFWSYDKPDDIQLINRDGDGYTIVSKPGYPLASQNLSFVVTGFRWSPDNQLLAIGGVISDEQKSLQTPMLYIYEPSTGSYTYRCPTGEASKQANIEKFFWSPDESMLIPEHVFAGLDKPTFRLFDLRTKIVYQLGHATYTAIGWVPEFSDDWK